MPDGEVKIHVSADADLKQIEAAQARIKELYQAAAAYESKGMGSAASSARGDAKSLERDVARFTKERAVAERSVTQEMKEQGALRKAGIAPGRSARFAQAAESVLSSAGGGTPGLGAAMNIGMRAGIPGIIATTIAAVTIGVARHFANEADKDKAQELGVQQRDYMRSYRRGVQSSVFGSSSGMVSDALAKGEEIEDRKSRRVDIGERAREKWNDPSSWRWFGARKSAGQREEETNEAEIGKLERQKALDLVAAKKKFMAEEGGIELDALRGRSKRSQEGSREAFVADRKQEWLSKYKSTYKESGNEDMAKEMADLTVQNKVRDMQAQAGAGLVSARSGGAGIAAAAQWATTAFPDVTSAIKDLHGTVQNQATPLEKQSK